MTEHAFILSGGGASGAYEIGVMKALLGKECSHVGGAPINPGIYTGTSVGAFNAAFMASPKKDEGPAETLERLEKIWVDVVAQRPENCGNGVFRIRGNALPFLNPACLTRHPFQPVTDFVQDSTSLTRDLVRRLAYFTWKSDDPVLERLLEFPDLSAFISSEPLDELVRENIDLKRLRRSPLALRVVATDWKRGLPRVFLKDELTDEEGHRIVLASAAIPAIFPPIEIGDDVYVDGGVTMNTPIKPAVEAWRAAPDPDDNLVIHVIYLDTEIQDIPLEKISSTFAVANRFTMIVLAHNFNSDIENARKVNRQIVEAREKGLTLANLKSKYSLTIHRYRPGSDLGGVLGLLDFRHERIDDLIGRGLEDTLAHDCEKEGCVVV